MPKRSSTTLKKRQKEIARMEKQRDKAARRMQRRLEREPQGSAGTTSGELSDPNSTPSAAANPEIPGAQPFRQ